MHGNDGDDTLNLAPTLPFGLSVIQAPVTFNGGLGTDTLNVGSGSLGAVSGLVTFGGGNAGNVINLFDGANPFTEDYTIGDTSITRSPSFFFGGVNYSGVSIVTLDATQSSNVITANLHFPRSVHFTRRGRLGGG